MKRWLKWTVAALLVALLVLGVLRSLSARKAKQLELETQQTAAKAQAVVELTPADWVPVKTMEMQQGLAVSGPLKAVNSAFIKARVAGELQGLTVREGDAVTAGQIIARIDSTEFVARVRQAQQQAESAKAQVDIAKRSFENNRSLVEQGFISKTALESSMATLAAAQASHQAAQAGADVATKSLDDTVLRAPITGVVSQRLAQPGERVGVDTRIVEIVDLSRLELEASLSAADSVSVHVGQSAQLTVEGATQAISAKVARINPSAVAGSRSVLAYLALSSGTGLRQGLFAQGTLATGTLKALAVPLSAVRTDKPQPYVQLVVNQQVVHQTVVPGARGEFDGQTMIAVQGLTEGAEVLQGRVGAVRAGTLVKTTVQGAR
jgi:RND family efflux transporter MFP subunit